MAKRAKTVPTYKRRRKGKRGFLGWLWRIMLALLLFSVLWVLAGIAVVAELTTGTFYLLMIALGLVGGALAAHAGLGFAMQLVAAAAIGGGGVAAWRVRRKRRPPRLPRLPRLP